MRSLGLIPVESISSITSTAFSICVHKRESIREEGEETVSFWSGDSAHERMVELNGERKEEKGGR